MGKTFLTVAGFFLITAILLFAGMDAFAQSSAEQEILGIIERVLDVFVRFIGKLLDELAQFFEQILPWGDDKAQQAKQ